MKLTIAKDELQFGHKQTLNKDFWKDEKLDTEVRLAIMAIVKNFLKTTNLEMTADEIDEIEFTGSLANYNYSRYSDVDIHLLFDFSKIGDDPEFMRDYLTTKAINWNNRHNVTIFGHEVELYITDAGSDHHSTGVYSVKDDKWLVKPVRDTKLSAELNLNKVKDKADKISKEIDMLVSVEGDLSLETIEGLKDKIKKMRVAGLETDGEFSIENLAFKLLRRRGELNTLYALMNQAQDAELSLDEDVEWWKKRRKKDNKNYRELMGHGKRKGVFKKKYAFKNVGKKNKLNRMSGAPYMINPQMKLPKSGPPGVGSLEEQYSQSTISTLNKIINKLDAAEPVEMKLSGMSFSGYKCLGPHSYTLKKSGSSYSIKLKQSLDSVITQQAKGLKNVGELDPLEKCVYERGEGTINSVRLKNIILDELSDGNASFVFVAPKMLSFDDFELSDLFGSAPESAFSKKIKKEPAGVLLSAIPLKDAYFINFENIKIADFNINDVIDNPIGFAGKLFTSLKAAIKKIIYYSKGKKTAIFFKPNRQDQVNSNRHIPTGDLDKVIVKAVREVLSENENLKRLPDAIKNTIITTITGLVSLQNLLKPFENVINFSTVDVFLQKLDDESDSDICKLFDCKKSTIKKKWSKKDIPGVTYDPKIELVGEISLINYIRGQFVDYKAPEAEVTGDLSKFLETLEQNIPASARKSKNPVGVDSASLVVPKLKNFRRKVDEGVLNAMLYMKQQMIKDNVPGASGFGIKSAHRDDALQKRLYNAYLNRKSYKTKKGRVLFKKKYCEEKDDKKRKKIFTAARIWSAPPRGKNKFTVKCEQFNEPDIVGDITGKGSPHRTGRAVDFNFSAISSNKASLARDKSNPIFKWLEKNAGKFGFIPYTTEPWHWEMSPDNADKWRNFGRPKAPKKD